MDYIDYCKKIEKELRDKLRIETREAVLEPKHLNEEYSPQFFSKKWALITKKAS